MSCKYSSAMLLLLGGCLSLSLMCSPADSNDIYTRSAAFPDEDNTQRVIANRASPANNQGGSVRPGDVEDVQRVQSNRVSPANNQGGSVRSGAVEDEQRGQPNRASPANNHRGSVRPGAVEDEQRGQPNRASPANNHRGSVRPGALAPAPPAGSAYSFGAVPNPGSAAAPALGSVSSPAQRQPPTVTTILNNDGKGQVAPWPSSTTGPARPPPEPSTRERFSTMLLQPISRTTQQRNMVYSPFSVHASLGMIYGVSEGETANELRRVGQFQDDQLAEGIEFSKLIQKQRSSGGAQFIIASNWFYDYQLSEINPDYQRFAKELYNSDVEAVDMKRSATTAARINDWASVATRGIVRELISPNDIGQNTDTLLVNAIYFKARWATEFSAMDTTPEKFTLSNNQVITVPMMFNDEVFPYAELNDLDAKALELPYAGTDASMLLILPNRVDGLPQLERQLTNGLIDLNVIASRLRRDTVTVRLPKFRMEFEQDMTSALQQLGVRRMFTKDSEVVALLLRPVQISKILQKAFIDVNEAGSEAAAASYAKFVPLSLPMQSREFTADHPFLFAIRTPDAVLFIGHVVQPTQ